MNKNLIGFAAVVLLFFAIAASFVGYALWKGNSVDDSSRAWAQTHIAPILDNWSTALLKQQASANYLHEIAFRDQLDANFKRWSQLGQLQHLGELTGQSEVRYPKPDSHKDPIFFAHYQTDASFSGGHARIEVELRQENGEWKWQSFTLTQITH